ncbi:MAG: cytidylate kinase-like family protein [Anaerovoracaceae bacterium]
MMNDQIVTISREFGSGGRLIGKKLADHMGVPYYDKELLNRIAEESGFSREMMEEAEMKAKSTFFYSLSSALGSGESGSDGLSLNERFFIAQFETIRRVAEEGSCVIVGRCADYVLRGIKGTTNIFIYAETEDKIKRAIEEYGVSEKDVKRIMSDTDKARANYYNYHTGNKWGAHVNYNLSIDSGYISIDNSVKLIETYLELKSER